MASTSLKNSRFRISPPLILLGIILGVAAFLRLYRIAAFMEFLGDQGRDLIVIYRFLKRGDLMFIGPQTSIGNMYLGPWYYYLIAPSLLLANFSPLGPAILVALLGVASVWLIWRVGKEWFGEQTGLWAALLMALSPVVIYYQIFSWNPNIMPFFSLLSMWLLWRIWQKQEYKKLPWLAVCLAMVLNSHYLGLLLLPPVILFWFLALLKQKNKRSYWLFSFVSFLIFLLLMSPLLLFDLKHDFANFNAFKKFFTERQITVNFKFYKGFLKLPLIFNQLMSNLLAKKDYSAKAYLFLPLFLWGIAKEKKNKALGLVVVWLTIGLLGLANYKQHIYAHYFGFLYPAAILLVALVLTKLSFLKTPLVLFLAGTMLLFWHGWQPPNFQLRRAQKVTDFILQESGGKKFALALIAEQNYDPPYRYFLMLKEALLVDLHEEIPEQLFVICEPWGKVNCNPLGHPKWQIAAFGWAKIEKEWELEGVKLFKLIHVKNKKVD